MADKKKEKKITNFNELRDARIRPKSKLQFLIKLFSIIWKDYKLIWRSTTSMLIFILGPLLIMFLVSIGFNTSSLVGLNVAVYSDSYSTLSESLVSNLSDSQFNVIKTDSQDECIDSVKFKDFQVCIIFPNNLALDNSANNEIGVYVDNSRLNIAHQITGKLSAKVSVQSTQLSSGLVNTMLSSIDNINREATQDKELLTTLKNSNKQANVQLDTLVTNFGGFDFAHDDVSMGTVYDAIETVRDRYNLSSSVFADLKAELTTMQESFNAAMDKLDSAQDTADALKDAGKNVAGMVSSDTEKLKTLEASIDSIQANIGLVKITNVESIVTPLKTTIHPLSLKKNYLLFTFPNLLILLVMVVAILMNASAMIRERKSAAYFRNYIAPTFEGLFILGQFITGITVIFVQLLIMLGIAAIFLTSIPLLSYIIIGAVLLLFATVFIFLGLGIGYLFTTEEGVTIGAISVALVSLLFSNAILPIEALSGILRKVVTYNPFVITEMILKRLILFDTNIIVMRELILILVGFVVVALFFAIIAREISKRIKH